MGYWVVYFEDSPAMLNVRKARRALHLAYLEQNRDKIVVAGGLKIVPDSPFVGGMWIVSAETYDDVIELVQSDPMFAPEFRNFRIFAWNKAFDVPVTL